MNLLKLTDTPDQHIARLVGPLTLLIKTLLLRPYVFLFLAAFLSCGKRLLGWKRTGWFFALTWITAWLCEFSSTRIGIPFGEYYYTGSTADQELYLLNVPLMDSLSFTFLLYASYCLALFFLLPTVSSETTGPAGDSAAGKIRAPALVLDLDIRTGWPAWWLTSLLFALLDTVIDPVALRGDRWFLGRIYGYPEPGVYYGVPIANFVGWVAVGMTALIGYFILDRRQARWEGAASQIVTRDVLLGCGLYYGVLAFNLAVTFWIGEAQLGMTGILIALPLTALFILRLSGHLPARSSKSVE